VLVAAKRDRFARDVVLAGMIARRVRKARATMATADGVGSAVGPEGEMMAGIVDVFAQYERAQIRSRTRAALGVLRARGQRVSGLPPYGYRFDASGVVLPEPAEQATLARLRELRGSVRAVAAQAASLGLRNRAGRPFAPSAVHAMRRAG
jgi:DNA invertase Pin-like site-specific DNA recombinase